MQAAVEVDSQPHRGTGGFLCVFPEGVLKMRSLALISTFIVALAMSACANDGLVEMNPDASSGSDGGATYATQGFALKIDPATSLPQDCTPPYDQNCTALGPDDQLTCLPTGVNVGKCALYSTDNASVYKDDFDPMSANSFTYISCPGNGLTDDDDYCATKNPYPNKSDYSSACIVTEKTAQAMGDRGRCAYFMKKCTVALNSSCEMTGWLIPGTVNCSVVANMALAVTEVCDGGETDENCNGQFDEEGALGSTKFWLDGDGDQYGSTGASAKWLCVPGNSYTATVGGDCNDSSAAIKPTASESCDNVDNDCDGSTDEAFGDLGASCGLGECAGGSMVCSGDGSKTVCSNAGKSTSEVCDGKDNNCDGKTDESYSDLKESCGVGACAGGSMMCLADKSGTECSTLINSTPEVCDSQDNDCDGATDETYVGLGDSCGVGVCSGGKMVCTVNKAGTECSTLGNAVTETCDNKDNDCNGKTDETYTDLNDSCGVGICAGGSMVCSGDGSKTVCSSAGNATSEVCDGKDNDCDGKTDEDFSDLGDSCGVGACAGGKMICNGDGSKTVCSTASKAASETCNQVDDDCDGKTDVDADGKALCDLQCPTVKKYDCNKEYEVDFSTLSGSSTIASYQCWTAAGAKTISTAFNAPEFMLAPNASNGVKYSFQITTAGTGALAALLHGTCQPDTDTTKVTAYNSAKGLNGTCGTFGTTSVNGGVAGTDYVSLDKATAAGKVKFKFICAP